MENAKLYKCVVDVLRETDITGIADAASAICTVIEGRRDLADLENDIRVTERGLRLNAGTHAYKQQSGTVRLAAEELTSALNRAAYAVSLYLREKERDTKKAN